MQLKTTQQLTEYAELTERIVARCLSGHGGGVMAGD
jgi:hypothetical protein